MKFNDIKILLAGICAFIVAIGTARFAFTALLPPMLGDFLSVERAGILAFANYTGYFVGSFATVFVREREFKILLFKLALFLSIFTTIILAFSENYYLWFGARVAAGVGSALVMGVGSSFVFDLLSHNKQAMAFYFSAAGISIVLTSLVGNLALVFFSWKIAWVFLIVFSLPLSIFALNTLTPKRGKNAKFLVAKSEKLPNLLILKILIFAYFLEGMGFVVQASFLPDIINRVKGLENMGTYAWYLVGVFAMFGPFVWVNLGRRFGGVEMMIVSLLLQILGILIPVFSQNLILNLLSGAIYGNTMMGLTALFMSYGASLAPKSSAPIMSALTAAYAIGTIIAPLYCAKIFNIYQSYDRALVLTAIFVGLSALSLGVIKFFKKEQKCHLSMSK
ncbi:MULTISPECIES: YbfB/YjiJ family MFS transporter [unclassified Campylobacter]|uniref:YbfB/YjiJ family MFS transporter n=1 Tax=unclassified Campylobacter TaxID=2593542 RepID=UPI0022E9E050|nr:MULTISPECIES: YbfB/YjiJ family MFS transporter [unclassified Campylobacter]MDA3043915.1 YbfB/YjiJ family MFS transporter [Campylobacter sp. JMF_09 ED2]MDA3045452.1 YbfB/YjiJ family MFS transporter [Campylobacter sp. JMF_07 ED4]MDA3064128.1 YbfB/YjiJ family MFS transporter [Campylobacter sp. JMF_11 EL3]MDA3072000.1 YbfB/YjiJ family MFS transporter [Campylobacter sp. VBCF_03 NA9]MDA3075735.1 YbfB/YjiJ family MFS transporter [Campylobacter sp. JMF_05 ED3]